MMEHDYDGCSDNVTFCLTTSLHLQDSLSLSLSLVEIGMEKEIFLLRFKPD